MKKFFSLMIMVLTLMSVMLVGCQHPTGGQAPTQTQTSEPLSSILPGTVWFHAKNNDDSSYNCYNVRLTFDGSTNGYLRYSTGEIIDSTSELENFTYETWYDSETYEYKVKVSFNENEYVILYYDKSFGYERLVNGGNGINIVSLPISGSVGSFTKSN